MSRWRRKRMTGSHFDKGDLNVETCFCFVVNKTDAHGLPLGFLVGAQARNVTSKIHHVALLHRNSSRRYASKHLLSSHTILQSSASQIDIKTGAHHALQSLQLRVRVEF